MKILTLNLNFAETRHGEWAARRRLICSAIKQEEPDVVALQAVRSDPAWEGGLDQASQLSRTLGSYRFVVFGQAQMREQERVDGLAFLSRVPILGNGHLRLTPPEAGEDMNARIVMHAEIAFGRERLHVFNAHTSWVEAQARRNLDEAMQWVTSFNGNAVLLGDLNTPPDSPALSAVLQRGWVDAWALLHPDDAGFTYESHRPDRRIDYAWVSPGLRTSLRDIHLVEAWEGEQDAPADDEPRGVRLSDHLGLLLVLEPPPP